MKHKRANCEKENTKTGKKLALPVLLTMLLVLCLVGNNLWGVGAMAAEGDFSSVLASSVAPPSTEPPSAHPPVLYGVGYSANGGTGGQVDPQSPYAAGATATVLPQGSVAWGGYSFVGWSTTPDSSGFVYAPGSSFAVNGDTVLYARWAAIPDSIITYRVDYDANGGMGAPATERGYTYDQQVTVSYGVPSRKGYTFLYWTTGRSKGTVYGAGNTFTIHSNTTLYAQWRSNGGSTKPASRSVSTAVAPSSTSISSETSSLASAVSVSTSVVSSKSGFSSGSSPSGGMGAVSLPSSSPSSSGDFSSSAFSSDGTAPELTPSALMLALKGKNVPIFSLGSNGVPLYNNGLSGTWALFNLFATVFGVLTSLFVLVRTLVNDKNNRQRGGQVPSTSVMDILIILFGGGLALLFLLAENMGRLMVFFNSSSALFAFIWVLQVVFVVLLSRKAKRKNDLDG